MKFDKDILNELQALSPLLASIQRKNIFFVPDGYFETLSNTILISLKEEAEIIDSTKKEDIPNGYFENLSSTILDKIKEQQKNIVVDEPAQLPTLLQSVQNTNPFKVPPQYFENLSAIILDKIKASQKDIAMEELEEGSPLLRSVQHINIFDLPQGYFDTVSVDVLNAVKASPAKVVGMPKLRLFTKYAAAAIITGAMALGAYKYIDKPAAVNIEPVAVAAAKIDSTIQQEKGMNEQQFNEALNNLTKEDITSYLEKNVSEEDMSLLISNVGEIGLPEKDDYLLNEKTLNNYLDKIKFQN